MKKPLLFTLCLGTLGSPLFVAAQEEDTDDGPVFELSPFVVETGEQDGYLATNSNSGTRLAQNIKDLPIPVEIITGEFIEDIGALNVKEALEFTAGLETEITSVQLGENVSNPNAFRLRGFVSEAVMRSGFRVIGTTDSINMAQVDVVRGPNALLYGIGNFGGVVNFITARPTPEFRGKVGLTYGSNDLLRMETQVRGPITERFGYSLGVFDQESNGWSDHGWSEKKGFSGLLEWKPTKKTTVTLEADYIYQDAQNPENPLSPAFAGFLNEGEELISPDYFPQTVLDVFGDNLYEDPDSRRGFLIYPRNDFRYAGLDTFNEIKDTTVILSLTHNFSENLSIQIGANYSERDQFSQNIGLSYSRGLSNILSDTAAGAINRERYPWMYIPQHPDYDEYHTPAFQALEYNWSRNESIQEREQYRAEIVYSKELFDVENTFIAGFTYNSFLPDQGASYGFKDTARGSQPVNSGDLSGLVPARSRYQSIYNYEPIRFTPSETEQWVETRGHIIPSKWWEKGYYFIHQAKLWDNKINTVAGIRYDWANTASGDIWDQNDEGFEEDLLGTIRTYNHRADGPSSDVNTSIGVSYAPVDQFSIFVLRATALKPIYNQKEASGFIMDPITGVSYELGLKFDFLRKGGTGTPMISGAASFYEIEREGIAIFAPGLQVYESARDDTAPNADEDWFAQGRNEPSANAKKAELSRGVDMQIFFTDIIDGLQTIFNFSYNDYTYQRLYGLSYVRKEGSGEDAEFIFETVDLSDTINPNRKYNDTPEYRVSIWNKYKFKDGPLDGVSVGLGFNWKDEREAAFGPFDSINAQYSLKTIPARDEWSASLSYSREIGDVKANFQLNVYNLLDDTGVTGYRFLEGRRFRVSCKVNF